MYLTLTFALYDILNDQRAVSTIPPSSSMQLEDFFVCCAAVLCCASLAIAHPRPYPDRLNEKVCPKHYCGSVLTDMLSTICLTYPSRIRRQISQKCCNQPCGIMDLVEFCNTTKEEFNEFIASAEKNPSIVPMICDRSNNIRQDTSALKDNVAKSAFKPSGKPSKMMQRLKLSQKCVHNKCHLEMNVRNATLAFNSHHSLTKKKSNQRKAQRNKSLSKNFVITSVTGKNKQCQCQCTCRRRRGKKDVEVPKSISRKSTARIGTDHHANNHPVFVGGKHYDQY